MTYVVSQHRLCRPTTQPAKSYTSYFHPAPASFLTLTDDHMSKALLISSAAILAALGFMGTFMPAEVLIVAGVDPLPQTVIMFQIMGGLYLGFALLNWMSRTSPMGGIYGKPLATSNLVHFMVVALMLLKEVFQGDPGNGFLILSVLYAVFAIGFATTLFRDPFSGGGTKPGTSD